MLAPTLPTEVDMPQADPCILELRVMCEKAHQSGVLLASVTGIRI